ncbi:chromate efflux transporter [Nisaea acidiphila]|uniref:Chromate efflux transporter n=1 Tax=Nisaea acidiphila TaxID=1862145 RepID=A0A9J7AT42_9PROT|nr:chromate efflux transporter [Nisaea acidiphila]UUX49657.1 chromate efflux transporter [Nisaea acidiphila]
MTDTLTTSGAAGTEVPSVAALFRVFLKIGLLSFGGPAAQIALMHRILVDEQKLLTERQYLNALSFCMLLPGPEAMQLATYAGWRLHGVTGGLIGGLLFVLPGAAVVLGLSAVYALLGNVPAVEALFLGVKSAVLIVVIEALLRVSKRALRGQPDWVVAGLAFVGIFFLALPFPLIIVAAALWGWFSRGRAANAEIEPVRVNGSARGTAGTVMLWLALWWLPVLAVDQLSGAPILSQLGLFFSKLAVVTFGGAYAVLAYMAQDVVGVHGWLGAGEMIDGLGLAETTPGPLILVTQFVGFLAAYKADGLGLGIAGAAVTLWVTFAPCFLWIFAGAPYIDWIAAQPRLSGALSAITAAVVGVILNLSLWFGLHVLFAGVERKVAGPLVLWGPDLATLDWRVAMLALLSAVLLLRLHWNIIWVLGVAAALGWPAVMLLP